MRISSAKKPARAKSTTPKESSSSRFGGFFRSISSRRFAPKTDSNANNNERTTTNTRRSRSRETTTERSKSSDERPCSSSSQRQLRSKSPSRERIEAFMADMKERERAVSRERRPQRINSNDRLVALFQASDERLLARQNSNQSLQRSSNHSQKSLLKDKNTTIINTRKTNSNENLMVRAPSDKGLIKRTDSNERLHNAPNDKERVRPRNPSKERLKRFLDSRAHSQRFLASVSSSGEEPDGKSVFPRSQSVCITPASAKSSTSIGYFKSFTSQSNRSIGSLSPRALFNQEPEILEDHSNEWHATISKRDWETLEQMMQSYNHKLYNKSPQKKLRVLKYFPNKAAPSIKEAYSGACPLLQVDSKGRTPLHLACKEHMPQKLFMRLFFMERNAACKLDTDGRVPLHYAIIANHSKHILDRLIRADPAALTLSDNLKRTPTGYAILRAEHKRDKSVAVTWRSPTTKRQRDWQNRQEENWSNVQFILETLVTRRKPLCKTRESSLLLESVECLIPPSTLSLMLLVSANILQEDEKMAMRLFRLLFRYHYPISILNKTLKICGHSMETSLLVGTVRQWMVDHYEEGCVGVFRDDKGRELSFRTELIQAYRNQQADRDCTLSQPCKEWWDKLRFLIGFSSYNLSDEHKLEDDYVLHAALTVPDTPTSLVEFLVRLVPSTRYETDPATGALPVHLACKYWIGYTTSKKEQRLSSQVLHLLLAGDSSLAWKRFKRRLPLHHAILSGKPLSFLQTLLAMDVKTANARDPLTRLFPFQLAAMESPNPRLSLDVYSRSTKSLGEDTGGLDVIYELLRANPIAVYPMKACGSGDPKGDIGPVAQHVLNYCYFYRKGGSETGWILNERRTKTLRDAISKGRMPENMKKWYGQLKQMIWKVYNERNTGKRVGLLPQKDEYLLHAALSNGGTPPIVIELMLELYPNSVHMRIPGTDKYPIHIAAASPSYARLPFEKTVSMGSALEMIALVDKDSLHLRSTGRSPLHIAIDGGKTWDELCPLIDAEPDFLAEPDLCSGLFPFQQVAAIETFTPTHQLIRARTSTVKWYDQSPADNGRLLRSFQHEYERDKLTSVYKILRADPEVLEVCLTNT